MNNQIYVVYPEERVVTQEQLIVWAKDAYANGEVEYEPENFMDAVALLEDCGHITIKQYLQ